MGDGEEDGDVPPALSSAGVRRWEGRRLRPLPWAVLAAVLAVTGALVWAAATAHDHSEARLLTLQVRQAGAVVTEAVPAVETPLTFAADLAAETGGDPDGFRTFMTRFVGARGPFVSASLWHLGAGAPTPVASLGAPSVLGATPAQEQLFFQRARSVSTFAVADLVGRPHPRLGYAAASRTGGAAWLVYTEAPLRRHFNVASNSAFSELRYALYLGRSARTGTLLTSSVWSLPVQGPRATVVVPFGDSTITLVGTPAQELSSS